MNDYKIITDSTSDMPESFYEENNVGVMCIPYILNGVTHTEENPIEPKEFYRMMREDGVLPTTSQISPAAARTYLEKFLKETKKLLVLAFSSGLSGSYNSTKLAADMIMEDDPEANIIVIDTLAAHLGEGLVVYTAVENKKKGMSFEENAKWISDHIQNFIHVFTVDDLFHLHRGGRVSKTAAVVGTMMSIKPVLHVDHEGHLIPLFKARGRKKAIKGLVDHYEEKIRGYEQPYDVVMVGHSDCAEELEEVKAEIEKRFGKKTFIENYIGPTIGAHTGPGTLTLFFMGRDRDN